MNLKEKRKALSLSQNEIGKKLNLTSQAIANYENGKRLPSILIVKEYSDILQVSIEEFIQLVENSNS